MEKVEYIHKVSTNYMMDNTFSYYFNIYFSSTPITLSTYNKLKEEKTSNCFTEGSV